MRKSKNTVIDTHNKQHAAAKKFLENKQIKEAKSAYEIAILTYTECYNCIKELLELYHVDSKRIKQLNNLIDEAKEQYKSCEYLYIAKYLIFLKLKNFVKCLSILNDLIEIKPSKVRYLINKYKILKKIEEKKDIHVEEQTIPLLNNILLIQMEKISDHPHPSLNKILQYLIQECEKDSQKVNELSIISKDYNESKTYKLENYLKPNNKPMPPVPPSPIDPILINNKDFSIIIEIIMSSIKSLFSGFKQAIIDELNKFNNDNKIYFSDLIKDNCKNSHSEGKNEDNICLINPLNQSIHDKVQSYINMLEGKNIIPEEITSMIRDYTRKELLLDINDSITEKRKNLSTDITNEISKQYKEKIEELFKNEYNNEIKNKLDDQLNHSSFHEILIDKLRIEVGKYNKKIKNKLYYELNHAPFQKILINKIKKEVAKFNKQIQNKIDYELNQVPFRELLMDKIQKQIANLTTTNKVIDNINNALSTLEKQDYVLGAEKLANIYQENKEYLDKTTRSNVLLGSLFLSNKTGKTNKETENLVKNLDSNSKNVYHKDNLKNKIKIIKKNIKEITKIENTIQLVNQEADKENKLVTQTFPKSQRKMNQISEETSTKLIEEKESEKKKNLEILAEQLNTHKKDIKEIINELLYSLLTYLSKEDIDKTLQIYYKIVIVELIEKNNNSLNYLKDDEETKKITLEVINQLNQNLKSIINNSFVENFDFKYKDENLINKEKNTNEIDENKPIETSTKRTINEDNQLIDEFFKNIIFIIIKEQSKQKDLNCVEKKNKSNEILVINDVVCEKNKLLENEKLLDEGKKSSKSIDDKIKQSLEDIEKPNKYNENLIINDAKTDLLGEKNQFLEEEKLNESKETNKFIGNKSNPSLDEMEKENKSNKISIINTVNTNIIHEQNNNRELNESKKKNKSIHDKDKLNLDEEEKENKSNEISIINAANTNVINEQNNDRENENLNEKKKANIINDNNNFKSIDFNNLFIYLNIIKLNKEETISFTNMLINKKNYYKDIIDSNEIISDLFIYKTNFEIITNLIIKSLFIIEFISPEKNKNSESNLSNQNKLLNSKNSSDIIEREKKELLTYYKRNTFKSQEINTQYNLFQIISYFKSNNMKSLNINIDPGNCCLSNLMISLLYHFYGEKKKRDELLDKAFLIDSKYWLIYLCKGCFSLKQEEGVKHFEKAKEKLFFKNNLFDQIFEKYKTNFLVFSEPQKSKNNNKIYLESLFVILIEEAQHFIDKTIKSSLKSDDQNKINQYIENKNKEEDKNLELNNPLNQLFQDVYELKQKVEQLDEKMKEINEIFDALGFKKKFEFKKKIAELEPKQLQYYQIFVSVLITLNRNCKNYNDNFMQIQENSTVITSIWKSIANLVPIMGNTLTWLGEWGIKHIFKIDQDEKYKNEFKLFKRFGDKYGSKTFKKLVKENWGISIVKNEKMKQIIDNIEDVIPENEETDPKGFWATFKDKLWKINSFEDSLVKPANLSKVENFAFSNVKAFARDYLMKITIKEGVKSKPVETYDYEEKIKFDNIINFLIDETDRNYKARSRPKTCWQKYCCKFCDFCLCCISNQEEILEGVKEIKELNK